MAEIKLIPATENDFEGYYLIKCGDEDIFWMGFTSKPDRKVLKKCFLERLVKIEDAPDGGKCIYMIKPADSDACLGYIQFTKCGDTIEIGISVGGTAQGKGIGKAAVRAALDVLSGFDVTVFARIRDDNVRSQKCFIANAFVRTEDFEPVDYPASGIVNFRKYEYTGAKEQSK